ncbi:MAG: S8 family serine peptidase, partial [Balneolaceae bacterium]
AAETDNEQGIAGAGYNVRYMPVKAGGIPEQRRSIAFGFEAIRYAAENGADIINCSWGGEGFSEAEQDVIDYATSLGSLVVAAAGNESLESITYPAGYRDVLAVGAIETSDDTRAQYSNYGYKLDVLATGTDVQSAEFGNNIGSKNGTSMATPVTAGLAGLIKSVQPDWRPERIAAYIRATAVSVDDNNSASERNRLGKGRLDAEAAVTAAIEGNLPGIVVNSYEFTSGDGEKLGLEEDGTINVELENVGASSQNISIEAVALNDDGITLEQPSQTISLDSEEEQEISIPIYIEENFDLSDTPTIRLNFSENTAGYNDFAILQYEDILFDVLAANNVKTSLAGDGTIGFTDPLNGQGGVGFVPREEIAGVYREGDNLLFEGGLIIEANGRIYDAVRTGSGGVSRDFKPVEIFNVREPGERSDLEGHTSFHFGDEENPLAEVDLTTYSFDEPELRNVLFVRYDIENPSGFVEVENMYVGLFNDWDIGVSAGMNGAAFSTPDSLLYLFDEGSNSDQPLVAVAPLGNLSSALAIDNAATNGADSLNFGIYDDFTDSEKSIALKAGTAQTEQSETDVSAVVASGPFTLAPRASATVGFVYAFGDNETELREQVSNARATAPFEVSSTGEVVAGMTPGETRLFQNYPNPFSSSTRLRVDLAEETGVEIDVFDVIGRRVAEIVDDRLEARTHIFRFAPSNLSSGVYLVRLKTDRDVQTIKMVFVK